MSNLWETSFKIWKQFFLLGGLISSISMSFSKLFPSTKKFNRWSSAVFQISITSNLLNYCAANSWRCRLESWLKLLEGNRYKNKTNVFDRYSTWSLSIINKQIRGIFKLKYVYDVIKIFKFLRFAYSIVCVYVKTL